MSNTTYWERSFMLGLSKLIVLSVLRNGPLHGYGIIKEVSARTVGEMALETGTLYTALKRLKDEKLIHIVER
ncbi:MAG: PadR family transcriptional regulator, partial [Candidatus Bathyarchaeota archaeon]